MSEPGRPAPPPASQIDPISYGRRSPAAITMGADHAIIDRNWAWEPGNTCSRRKYGHRTRWQDRISVTRIFHPAIAKRAQGQANRGWSADSRQTTILPFKSAALKDFLKSGIGAAMMWVVASLMMAAILSPWAYEGGKWLAAAGEARELPRWLDSLAGSCGRAQIDRYFDRCLLFAALVLLPSLFRRLKRIDQENNAPAIGLVRYSPGSAVAQIAMGCLIAGGLLGLMGILLDLAGVYQIKASLPDAGKFFRKAMIPAVAAPLVEEWLFRGVLLGLWLRFARRSFAVLGTSLVFAFLHFLNPPTGLDIAVPGHPLAGFELLGKILLHFADPLFFVTDFATLFMVGLILAWARLHTGALWFSIGLHAGWVLAFKAFNLLYQAVEPHSLRPWGIGESIRSGLLPMFTLLLTALVCRYALRPFSRASQ
jgi:membrane protease YdiL (CAAX protease family)